MAPEVYAAFVRGFTAAWDAEQKGCAVAEEDGREELKRRGRKIDSRVVWAGLGGRGGCGGRI